jgi:hypothetical protein
LGVDHKTVRSVRITLEAWREIPELEKFVGADGKIYPRERNIIGGYRLAADHDSKRRAVEQARRNQQVQERLGVASTNSPAPEELTSANYKDVPLLVDEIVRVRTHNLLVRFTDGRTGNRSRKELEKEGWKKCHSCKGYGVVEK